LVNNTLQNHSVANAMGVPQFEISKALGHSTPAITGKTYTHVFDDTHAGIVNVVQNAIDDKKK
jgi:integrase